MECSLCTMILLAIIALVIYTMIGHTTLLGDIKKRAIFITGCDSGFGAALARRLDRLGVRVFAGCLTEEGAGRLEKECSPRVQAVRIDITSTASIEAAYDTVRTRLNPGEVLWAVVNNAGLASGTGSLDFINRQTFTSLFEVNVYGMAEVSRLFLPLLKESRGRIVNMTSIAGVQAFPLDIVYSASKFAAEGLSDALRRTLHVWGISVHIIEPSLFKTSIINDDVIRNKLDGQWAQLPAHLKEEYGEEYFQELLKVYSKAFSVANPSLDHVLDAYHHALFAKYPYRRYQVGLTSKIFYVLSLFPASIGDVLAKVIWALPMPKRAKTHTH